jgi:hypothetical protein
MAGAALVTAALSGAGEARAQACTIPDEVPPALYEEVFLDTLGQGFPMPEAACERLTKTAVATCHKTVSAAARCWKGVAKGLGKGGKTTCPEQGVAEQACFDAVAGELAGLESGVAESEAGGHALCDAGALLFQNYCLNGIP